MLVVSVEASYSLGNSYRDQMEEMAKNYAEKKYDRKYKVEKSYDNGLSVVLGEYKDTSWFTSEKISQCTVFLINVNNHINANPGVANIADKYNINSDNCGESVMMLKIKKYIDANFISKYYNLDKLDFRISVIYNTPKNYYDLERLSYRNKSTYKIFNQDNNWNLTAKEWLVKHKDKIQINNASINIYEQPETAENIAKAMEFGYKLDKYLRSLTDSHKINGIYIYLYTYNKDYVVKHGGTIWYTRLKGDKYYKYLRNYFFTLGDGGYKGYIPITSSNIFELVYITSSNREDNVLIKNTKYYQPVKKILAEKFENK